MPSLNILKNFSKPNRLHFYDAKPLGFFSLPMTTRLLPHKKNLRNLIETTALVRLGTSFIRVNEEKPSKQPKDSGMTTAQKWQQFCERIWVEIMGTASYIGVLQLATDLVARFLERFVLKRTVEKAHQDLQLRLKDMVSNGISESLDSSKKIKLSQELADEVLDHFHQFFMLKTRTGEAIKNGHRGIIARQIFDHDYEGLHADGKPFRMFGKPANEVVSDVVDQAKKKERYQFKISIDRFKKHMLDHGLSEHFWDGNKKLLRTSSSLYGPAGDGIAHVFKPLSRNMTYSASASLAAGAVLAALYGGFVVQAVNDKIVAPILAQIFKENPRGGREKKRPDVNPIPPNPFNSPLKESIRTGGVGQ